MELIRVNCREPQRWWSKTLCGAKALHVVKHLRHPRLHLLMFYSLFFLLGL
jgi:hypothetical protein